jgi:thiamine kinase-like enzyme
MFTRAIGHSLQLFEPFPISETHFDTIFVLMRYSTECFQNEDFSKYISRSINIITTYVEYVKLFYKTNDDEAMIANDALQLILHRFPSTNACNLTRNQISETTEHMMRDLLEDVKQHQPKYRKEPHLLNKLAESIYRKYNPRKCSE